MEDFKILLLYKSKTGFTKRYADWISEEIGCAVADYKTATLENMSAYDTVVFGSRAHAGRIDGYKKIREMFQKSGAKHFALFVTGATPCTEEKIIEEFWKKNLSEDELLSVPHFYLQSGLNYERMCFSDKIMMKAAAAMLKKKKDKDAYDKAFEQAISGSYDISSKEYARPLVLYLKGLA